MKIIRDVSPLQAALLITTPEQQFNPESPDNAICTHSPFPWNVIIRIHFIEFADDRLPGLCWKYGYNFIYLAKIKMDQTYYISVRVGCHLVEEILQYVHFRVEQIRLASLLDCTFGCLKISWNRSVPLRELETYNCVWGQVCRILSVCNYDCSLTKKDLSTQFSIF